MIAFTKSRWLSLLTLLSLLVPVQVLAATAPQVQILEPVSTGVSTPLRLASDRAGNIYLADPRAGGVVKFAGSGLQTATFAVSPPRGIAVTDSGDIIISQDDSVVVLGAAGQEKFRLGKGASQFKKANGIAIDAAGYIYVVDSLDDCVQVFTSQGVAVNSGHAAAGKPANSFGSSGTASGQLSMPTAIAYEKVSGQLAVVDTGNGRIQFFDTAGGWKKSIGGVGAGAVGFTVPVGVAFEYGIGGSGPLLRMYVADSFQSSIQVVDPAAANPVSLGFIGGYGRPKGKLLNPADVLFDPLGGRLLVANGFGNIAVYGINGGGTPTADTTPPPLTLNPVPTVTASSTLILSGTVESGAALAVTTDTAAVAGTPQITATGAWTATVTLVPGSTGITVTATDSAGNVTTRSLAVTFSATAVHLTIDRLVSPVNTQSVTVTGTMDAGATVAITLSTSATAGTVTYPTATTWSSTITGLVSGENIVTATAARAGSVTAISSAAVVLDTVPPPLNLAMPADGSTTSAQLLTVAGLTAAEIATVSVNGDVVAGSNGLFSKGIVLRSGSNTITVIATDAAGNTTRETRRITYDPTTPAVSIATPTAGRVTNQTSLLVSGTSASGSSTVIKVNGAVQTTLSGTAWTTTVNLTQGGGLYTIEALATDIASGRAATTAVMVELVDLAVPAMELSLPPMDLITNNSSITVSGSATTTVSATVNGVAVAVTQDAAGGYSLTVPLSSEGVYMLQITATNPFGATSTLFRTLIHDVTPPILSVTTQSTTAISGSGEADSVVTVRNASGTVVGTTTVRPDGSWSLTLAGNEPLPLSVDARDAAGNSSRNGDIDGSGGAPTITDALKAMRFAIKAEPAPAASSAVLLRGDVAPLVNGVSMPDGRIDIDDVMVILMKAVGLIP